MGKGPLLKGLAPLCGDQARVLILGSMPSAASLARTQYYGHPRNRFWPLMATLFGFEPDATYAQRCDALCASGVAVWDVIGKCRREGSLDSAIEADSLVVNDFPAFWQRHGDIRHVFLNGGLASRLFRRHAQPALTAAGVRVELSSLPSTSPANAGWSLQRLQEAWSVVAKVALGRPPNPR